ncbi:hepatoma-derived growth factor-related protein 2 isoform X3 [Octopus vulgaris]|uniref:Hepatoma-derived growth factor-related protein 2 isoform X3 n=1 Tax=Octopus vulgaris TaxID=6645 RepID=A0AA36BUY0_OCTVU|nr:hepatoma-derived growth factor-related protein 2 isoform X3 [Octopus vulgaris]
MDICVKNVFSVKTKDYEKCFELQPSLNFDQNFPLLDMPDELLNNENKNSLDPYENPAVEYSGNNSHIPSKRPCSSKEFDFGFQKSFVSARQLSQSVNDSLKSEVLQRENIISGEDFVVPTCNLNESLYGNLDDESLKDNDRSSNQSSVEAGNLSESNYKSVENIESNKKHQIKSEKIKPTFGNQTKKILKLKDNNKSSTKNSGNIEEINGKQVAKTNTASPLSNKSSLKENSGDNQDRLHCKAKSHVIHKTSSLQMPSKNKNQNPSKKSKSKSKQENNGSCKNVYEVPNFEQSNNNNNNNNNFASGNLKENEESENDSVSNKVKEKNSKKVPPLKISAINSEIHGNFPKFKSDLTEKYVKENKKQKRMKSKNTSSNSSNDTLASSDVRKTFSVIVSEQITECNNNMITERETVIKKLENYKIPLKSKTADKKKAERKDEKENNGNISNEIGPAIVSPTFADMNSMNKPSKDDSVDTDDEDRISDLFQKENIYETLENINNSKQNEQILIARKIGLPTSDSESSVAIEKPVKSKPKLKSKSDKHDKNKLKSIKHKEKDSAVNKTLDLKQNTHQSSDSSAKKISSKKIKNSSKATEGISCKKSKAPDKFDKRKAKDNTLAVSKKKRTHNDKNTKNIKLKKADFETKSCTWVECTQLHCHKWRWLQDVHDPLLIPHNWICDMNPDATQNDCSIPEIDYCDEEFIFTRYTEGSLVWARVEGYPWWPAMVEIDPDYTSYFEFEEDDSMYPASYHVVFFGKKVSRAWVPLACVKPFETSDSPPASHENVKYSLTDQRTEAIKSANEAMKFDLKVFVICLGCRLLVDISSR